MSELPALAKIFGELSMLAIGGVAPLLPEMQRQVVDVHHYMDRHTFSALFALAQAAPGPNMMVSTLVGWQVAGVPGALVATAGMIGPSSILTFTAAGLWHRFRERTWRITVQAGLVPVTVGLVAAGAAVLAKATTQGWLTAAITAFTAVLLIRTKVHPLLLLAAGAALAAIGRV